jgi:hypothetical protein
VRLLFVVVILILSACSQNVHIKTSQRVTQVVIDGAELGPIGPEGKDVVVPVKFGAASYSLYDGNKIISSGFLPRSQIYPWSYGLSIGGAMVAAPVLGFVGAVAVNPAWFFAPAVFLHGGGAGSFWAHIAQIASMWTFPAATLGILIGLLPLLGLVYSERLPDVVLLNTNYGTRP